MAKVRSFYVFKAAFVLIEISTKSYHCFTFPLNSKISIYIYYSLLEGFKEGNTFDSYLLCFCFPYPFPPSFSLYQNMELFLLLFLVYMCLVLKGFISVSILNLYI